MKLHKIALKIIDLPSDFSFKLAASVYNFSWYFDGSELITPINYEELIVAAVKEVGDNIILQKQG